jgi:hypothetical protein
MYIQTQTYWLFSLIFRDVLQQYFHFEVNEVSPLPFIFGAAMMFLWAV